MKILKRTLLPALLLSLCFVVGNASAAKKMSSPPKWCPMESGKTMCKMKMKMYKSQYKMDMKQYNMTKKICGHMRRGRMSGKMYNMKMKMCRMKMMMYKKDYNMHMQMYKMYMKKCRMMRS